MSTRQPGRRVLSLLVVLIAGMLLGLLAAPAGARVIPMEWHRLDIGNDPPSHERLKCLTDGEWRCRYTSVPGPGLTNGTFRGTFEGTDVTDSWVCPDWLGEDICGSVVRVVSGMEQFFEPGTQSDPEFPPVRVELIVLDDGTLWVAWIDSLFGTFACPWYETFDDALISPSDCRTS
jgi:hypothetical protein